MFGSKKKTETPETSSSGAGSTAAGAAESSAHDAQHHPAGKTTQGKGRPTPTRKEREAARRQPLVPTDRKAAKQADREAQREARLKQNVAMQNGDERYLPEKDKGDQRRYVRNYVDARRNLGDYFFGLLIVVFLLSLFLPPAYQTMGTMAMLCLILIWVIDTWFLWRGLKKRLLSKFGTSQSGNAMYATNRVMMIRRLRLPKPQVQHGEYPQ